MNSTGLDDKCCQISMIFWLGQLLNHSKAGVDYWFHYAPFRYKTGLHLLVVALLGSQLLVSCGQGLIQV
jgi:hypothetical protein